ncbi:mitochondrial bifunctional diaminopelargonate synthetase, partial [Genlisea aurea]
VLGLRGSYHGDTLGAMEAQASSPYTGFLQQPWYSGRGVFLDPPTVGLHNGKWEVLLTEKMLSQRSGLKPQSFSSLDDVFVATRDDTDLSRFYSSFITSELQSDNTGVSRVGALIIEPGEFFSFHYFTFFVHGAGGMQLIDPLYQKILIRECKKRKVPVIFDEVFTGFWRLGRESAAKLLGCEPDIACFAKLMTGGIIPLAVTLASSAVFDAFKGDSKVK